MLSTLLSATMSQFSVGAYSEGGPQVMEVPTLPTGQALILMIGLVIVLVLALYWNARSYKLPEGIGSHSDTHGGNHSAEAEH